GGVSILMTLAPQSASWRTQVGPDRTRVKSRTVKRERAEEALGSGITRTPECLPGPRTGFPTRHSPIYVGLSIASPIIPDRRKTSARKGRKRLLFIISGSNLRLCLEKTTSTCHMTANG